MSIVLKNQVEASEKSVGEIESVLRVDHNMAMICYDVEDLMKSLVDLFGNINADVERWQRVMANGPVESGKLLERFGNDWDSLYRRAEVIFGKVFNLMRSMEDLSFKLDGKKQFLTAWRELRGVVCFSLDSVTVAVEQVRRGETRTLGEVVRELCDRPVN